MEKKVAGQDEKVLMVFEYLKPFIREQETPRIRIGFKAEQKKKLKEVGRMKVGRMED